MTNSAQSCAVQIRGAGVGATTATTAILAHGCAGGHWPGSAEWVLLLAVCCSLGVIAVSANIFSRRVGLLMAVSGGQLAGHAVLSLSPLEHHHSMTSVPMMVLHATAVAVCCMVIPLAERAVRGSVSWVLRAATILVRPPLPMSVTRVRVPGAAASLPWTAWVGEGSLNRRGPPRVLACAS
ncbi:hypothetical protein ACBG85_30495 (plasmid) [Rhodococcus sp. NyZ502]|uniref:hypothetical protein n=1 Tax=Rhodococcus sp. NyZ502 TaxID=3242855 RepID=UPI00355641C1